uniref:Reverse transcriptase zinc-binding domain-containing protein n=1 Tax=Nicotiana tabacum TaxID=4097 RepID=A0A1S4DMQ8_TOBAC|nr:PREDICTED: uncharacterized protein LOC107831463 [Nicotiana tabacum]
MYFSSLLCWIPTTQRNVCFLAWLAARGVILTAENLRKKRITYISWCFAWKSSGENADHLLLHCQVATRLWRMALNLFGLEWVMSGTVKEALLSWAHSRGKRTPRAWILAPLAIMWVIWKERNKRAFEGVGQDFVKLQSSLLFLVSFWGTYEIPTCIEDRASFIENHISV